MEYKDENSCYYCMNDAPTRYPSFSPIDFDVSGVLAGYQENPICDKTKNDAEWGPIIRDYYVIYYVVSGSGSVTIDDKTFSIKAPQLFITFPDTVVTEYTEKNDPWEYHYIHLKSSSLRTFLDKLGVSETQPCFKLKNPPDLTPTFERLAELRPYHTPSVVFERVSLMSKLFTTLFEYVDISSSSDESGAGVNEYVSHSLRYFDLHYRSTSVNAVADALGLTRSYFSTLFKKHMNISPQEYLIRLKINKACEFLLLSNSTISNVANSVGYDLFAFSRIFKKIVGVSPSEYQKNNR